jgi:ribonuclease Y
MDLLAAGLAALVFAVIAAIWRARRGDDAARAKIEAAEAEASALHKTAERDAAASIRTAETSAREAALGELDRAEAEATRRTENLARRRERLAATENAAAEAAERAKAALDALDERSRAADTRRSEAQSQRSDADRARHEVARALEERAGTTGAAVRAQLAETWIEEARAEGASRVRLIEQSTADPEWGREAQRIMGVASQRFQGHYLTERLLSNVPLPPGLAEILTANDQLVLRGIQEGSGVKMELNETGDKVRLDSGDGVAREIARRALSKIIKGTAPREAAKDPKKWVEQIGANLNREIMDLGKRAFSELEIPKAHPEIVMLVGRLNYRTSYTQNQWKHAMEAAFLGGMMAAELRLDVKLARRATLMHDIGKALTHEIDGSHAVIGADYARRLGEAEIVANAIGAHHADEPPNSIYAYLVAAADAMSGARPGARREQTESFSTRVEDVERIGGSFRGVDGAVAVQGGRELRVYVRENEVDDLRTVELSAEIAKKISDELVFPGQIKVTVIRTVEAVEIAN